MLLKNEHVFAGSGLTTDPRVIRCDLGDPGQRITLEVTGTYTSRSILGEKTSSLNLAKDSPSYRLPTLASPNDELPRNDPKSQTFILKSSAADPEGGAYSVTCQINTMAYIDPWKNLWDTSLP